MHPTDFMPISMKKQRNIIFLWELENFFTVVFNSANDCNRKELINFDIPFLNYLYYNLLLEIDSFKLTYQVTCSVCFVCRNSLDSNVGGKISQR